MPLVLFLRPSLECNWTTKESTRKENKIGNHKKRTTHTTKCWAQEADNKIEFIFKIFFISVRVRIPFYPLVKFLYRLSFITCKFDKNNANYWWKKKKFYHSNLKNRLRFVNCFNSISCQVRKIGIFTLNVDLNGFSLLRLFDWLFYSNIIISRQRFNFPC